MSGSCERSIRRSSADLGVLLFTFSTSGHPTHFINIYGTVSLLRVPKCGGSVRRTAEGGKEEKNGARVAGGSGVGGKP